MCVARFSCPQLLDATLRAIHHPVDEKSVGVGCYLGRDPSGQPHEGCGQRLPEPKGALETRKADLNLLPHSRASGTGFAAKEHDPRLGQLLFELPASVSQVPKQLPRYL